MTKKTILNTRAGIATIVGGPNVGKSTLINRIIGSKISIVSPKVQTTRSRIRGICVIGSAQLVVSDTPGIFRGASRRLDRAMIDAAWHSVRDADAIVFLIDAGRGLDVNALSIIDELTQLLLISDCWWKNPMLVNPVADVVSINMFGGSINASYIFSKSVGVFESLVNTFAL